MGKFALKVKRDRKFANVFRDFVTLNEDLRILMLAIVSSPERFLLCDRDVLLQVAPTSSFLLSLPGPLHLLLLSSLCVFKQGENNVPDPVFRINR